jgi:hypothetical protein
MDFLGESIQKSRRPDRLPVHDRLVNVVESGGGFKKKAKR